MTALAYETPAARSTGHWDEIAVTRPRLSATVLRYLAQIELSLSPRTIEKTDEVLLGFCRHLIAEHPALHSFAEVGRAEIESFKAHLASRTTRRGTPIKANTRLVHLALVRVFFDRIVEWRWEGAPAWSPVFRSDMPKVPEPLPKALDDAAAARFLAAAAVDRDKRRQLCVELLARTGMRVGELCSLERDAMSCRSGSWWLRIPVGKLRTDRYVPLHPRLVELINEWRAGRDDGSGLLITMHGKQMQRFAVARMVKRVAKAAGIGHVHPHQLRHTLATQAINRGMPLEAVAELLGHRNLNMTQAYARISNRTVADQFKAVQERVDALYADLDADEETPAMRKLRLEHRRLLGNGWCTRPPQLDCHFEALCERCGFFETTVEFLPTLRRQRDHAASHGQELRTGIYERLVAGVEERQ